MTVSRKNKSRIWKNSYSQKGLITLQNVDKNGKKCGFEGYSVGFS
jgi:hypothetical protein